MNTIWSKYVQGTNTLYFTRKLRFDEIFATQYKALFALDEKKPLKILEIGCGPGALAEALQRYYPNAVITAIDRDSEFIRFARSRETNIDFIEGDATVLPFPDNSFDVTISNTVCEHIEPSSFYGEQLRVLKPGGICLVLSARRGIHVTADCLASNEYEKRFWDKVNAVDDSMERFSVCQYPMSESELPLAMEKYGFHNVRTGYATIDLTPDHPKYSPEMAHQIINANRLCALDGIEFVLHTLPEHVSPEEIDKMKRLTNAKYDARIAQYERDEKQWDTNVSITMVVRGEK